jgi:flagellar biosynthesis protein FlhB
MFGDDHDDRTEPPSPRRLEEARRSGYVARSRDLTTAVVLLGCSACLFLFGPNLTEAGRNLLRDAFTTVSSSPAALRASADAWQSFSALREAAIGALVLLMLAAVAANVLQFGFRLTADAVRPSWRRVSLSGGLRRVGASAHPAGAGFTLLKFMLVGLITVWSVIDAWPQLAVLSNLAPADLAAAWGALVIRLAWQLAAVLLALSVGDFLYQRRRYELSLRMTREEAREEARLQERDPAQQRRQRGSARPLPELRSPTAI